MAALEVDLEAFQSTLPVGGATWQTLDMTIANLISIHAPRGGSDFIDHIFTSTKWASAISIHAPRGGSDGELDFSHKAPPYFNPRSPWGERLSERLGKGGSAIFQSTLPVGGATISELRPAWVVGISIHAPRGGSDNLQMQILPKHLISIHAPRGGSDPMLSKSESRYR